MATDDKSTNVTTGSSAKNEVVVSAAIAPPTTGMAVTTNAVTAEPPSTGMAVTANAASTESAATGMAVIPNAEGASEPICWQSGDWQEHQGTVPPYNGIEVLAVPVYGNTGSLESVGVTIVDYTLIKEGAKTLLDFTLSQITHEKESPLTPKTDSSTLDGFIKFRLLQNAPDHALLFLSLTYGLVSPSNKNVQGCILHVPLTAL
ncbi:MAG: hypothetical protein Q8L15_00950 [Methylobacter sp.]|nr:hypothetical protein [Methylobacter sp.]